MFERGKEAMDEDEELSELRDILVEGEIQEEDMSTGNLKPYRKYIGELTLLDGVIFYGNRIVIPRILRKELLDILHKAHQGVDGMYHVARLGYVIFARDILNQGWTVECGHNFSAESSTVEQAPVLLAHPV